LANSFKVHRTHPSGGSEQANATNCTSSLPLSCEPPPDAPLH
jgi:hypothetical protein